MSNVLARVAVLRMPVDARPLSNAGLQAMPVSFAAGPRFVPQQSRQSCKRGPVSVAGSGAGDPYNADEESLYVPPDAFAGDTPEGKAGKSLSTLFTYVAVRVVMEQMSGSRHRSPMYNRLRDYINDEEPIRDGSQWLGRLMRHTDNEMRLLALRIMETREIYMDNNFDWDDLREVTEINLKKDNADLKKQWIVECMSATGEVEECRIDDLPEEK
mmetsp:Transcript_32646/g.92584  ORF Transcript_32646/g.92584 Transcript_32646/m.92584 type:complete len:214 (+) Transcript_32646:467-1108(+)